MKRKKPFHLKTEHEKGAIIRDNMNRGELRCTHCDKKFLEGTLGAGTQIEIRCPRCKGFVNITKI